MRVAKKSKRKKKLTHQPTRTPFEIVKQCNYLHLAVIVRVLWMVYGWRHERLGKFLEAYLSLLSEVADRRSGVMEFVKDTTELTGIDVKLLMDEILEG